MNGRVISKLLDTDPNRVKFRGTCDYCGRPVGGVFAAAGVYCSHTCADAMMNTQRKHHDESLSHPGHAARKEITR